MRLPRLHRDAVGAARAVSTMLSAPTPSAIQPVIASSNLLFSAPQPYPRVAHFPSLAPAIVLVIMSMVLMDRSCMVISAAVEQRVDTSAIVR